jgi:hypothetical protein
LIHRNHEETTARPGPLPFFPPVGHGLAVPDHTGLSSKKRVRDVLACEVAALLIRRFLERCGSVFRLRAAVAQPFSQLSDERLWENASAALQLQRRTRVDPEQSGSFNGTAAGRKAAFEPARNGKTDGSPVLFGSTTGNGRLGGRSCD